MDWPVEFEVHIVRAPFQAVFGPGSKPQMHDYMYFEQFLNRMYEVNAVAEPDGTYFVEVSAGDTIRVDLVNGLNGETKPLIATLGDYRTLSTVTTP